VEKDSLSLEEKKLTLSIYDQKIWALMKLLNN